MRAIVDLSFDERLSNRRRHATTADREEGPLATGRSQILGRMWRSSPAERRAVQDLVDGVRTSGIAVPLQLSVHDIRTQLKRAMAKAGVHAQTALVARALSWHTPIG